MKIHDFPPYASIDSESIRKILLAIVWAGTYDDKNIGRKDMLVSTLNGLAKNYAMVQGIGRDDILPLFKDVLLFKGKSPFDIEGEIPPHNLWLLLSALYAYVGIRETQPDESVGGLENLENKLEGKVSYTSPPKAVLRLVSYRKEKSTIKICIFCTSQDLLYALLVKTYLLQELKNTTIYICIDNEIQGVIKEGQQILLENLHLCLVILSANLLETKEKLNSLYEAIHKEQDEKPFIVIKTDETDETKLEKQMALLDSANSKDFPKMKSLEPLHKSISVRKPKKIVSFAKKDYPNIENSLKQLKAEIKKSLKELLG